MPGERAEAAGTMAYLRASRSSIAVWALALGFAGPWAIPWAGSLSPWGCATARADTGDEAESRHPVLDEGSVLDNWSFIPIVFYTPETAVGFGAAVIHSFSASDLGTAHLSTVAGGLIATTRGQLILRLEPEIHFDDVSLLGLVRFQRYPTRFFEDGARLWDEGEPYDELALMSHMDVRYRLGAVDGPLHDLAGGLRCEVRWNRVTETEAEGAFETADPIGLAPWVAMGCGPVLAWDSRDDTRSPTRGIYAQVRTLGVLSLFGDSFKALATDLDLRGYVDLGARHVLATQLALRTTLGDLPYQIWPRLGGSNLHRGWFEGHLRGQHSLLAQLEWRFPIVGKVGAVVFGSAGQAFDRFSDVSARGLRFAAGAGLRFLLNQRQQINLRLDLAWGNGLAVYVDVLEAF